MYWETLLVQFSLFWGEIIMTVKMLYIVRIQEVFIIDCHLDVMEELTIEFPQKT